jgi:hypothetical protein
MRVLHPVRRSSSLTAKHEQLLAVYTVNGLCFQQTWASSGRLPLPRAPGPGRSAATGALFVLTFTHGAEHVPA